MATEFLKISKKEEEMREGRNSNEWYVGKGFGRKLLSWNLLGGTEENF
jgi:hypothetical protein